MIYILVAAAWLAIATALLKWFSASIEPTDDRFEI